jgi:hypothetical protein
MFRTLKQALSDSPVDMALVMHPLGTQLVKLADEDGSYRVILSRSDGSVVGQEKDAECLDKVNRHLVLRGINCRPVIE